MPLRDLRKTWRRYSLRDSEEAIPPGAAPTSPPPATAQALLFDPQDPDFVADPYRLFCYLRENEPIQRGATGAWVLSRYQDISSALVDNRLGNAPSEYATVHQRNRDRYLCAEVANNILPFLDPPEHSAPRKMITQSFHQHIKRNPPALDEVATELLAGIGARSEFDLMKDFATPFSARVFCRLLDLDETRVPDLLQWSDWFFYLLTVIPSQHARARIDDALEKLRDCFGGLVEARRAQSGSDYVSRLLALNEENHALDHEQLVDNLILLFADAVGNVDKGICAAVALLLQNPDQLEILRQEPELLPGAIDECLRYESPAQFIGRVAREDLEINGQAIRRNEAVILLLGSANRDPQQFDNADSFDIRRFPNPHLSFGRSRHVCIGAPLVRMEMQAAIKAVFESFPGLALSPQHLNWQLRMGHRWLAELQLRTDG